MRVRMYRNLSPRYRAQRAWSIAEAGRSGKIIDALSPAAGALLKDVTFYIDQTARQRYRDIQAGIREARDKGKFVHAWVEGELVKAFALGSVREVPGDVAVPGSEAASRVNYDPNLPLAFFFRQDCAKPVAVERAPVVVVTPAGVFAKLGPCPTGAMRGFSGLMLAEGWF